jgi:hypothetical protein
MNRFYIWVIGFRIIMSILFILSKWDLLKRGISKFGIVWGVKV